MADTPESSAQPFLTLALSRWKIAETAEGPMRTEGEKDLLFLNLEQWDPTIVSARGDSRPCLTIDQIGEPYRQLVGQMRSSKPAIQVNPVDNGADVDTAEVFQGLIRHVENTGHAKAAREEAFKGAVGPGWGYYRLYLDYEYQNEPGGDPAAMFDQCIKYQPIENPFTVFRDPACPLHEPWKCRFALHIEDVPIDEFQRRWPDAISSAAEAFTATGMAMPDWYPAGSVRVADYFYVEETPGREMAQLQDGRVVPLLEAPVGVPIVARRRMTTSVVKLAKITGAEILEGDEPDEDDKPTAGRVQPWPYIPIVPMYGEALTVQGKRNLRGIVRAARDVQRMYNYQNSELVYELALAPKSKVIMAEGQDEGYQDMWKRAPSEAFPALKYKPVSLLGQPVPPPQVAQYTDPAKIQALVIAINQHKADLRSTTGWYDATDPSRKNTDQSGRAILARKEAQADSAVNYKDNFGQALLFEGMLLLGAIPKVYHRVGRVLRIVGLEDESQTEEVTVGQPRKASKAAKGVQGIFAWGAGRFDVTVSIGAAYSTRRQEAADTGMQLMEVLAKTHPPAAAAIAPSVIAQMDIPNARQMADQARRSLPPELRDDAENQQVDPQMLQAENGQLKMQMQEMGQVIQGLQEAVKTDQVKAEAGMQETQLKAQAEAEKAQQSDAVKLEIARMDNETKIAIEERKIQAEMLLAQMKIDAELEKARITAMASAQAQMRDQRHEQGMAERGHQQEMEAGEMGHHHAMEEQANQSEASA